jgi:hypothetical protein
MPAVCYLPVVKANPQDSNLCVVPYTALSPTDLAGTVERGAMHFVKLCEENLPAIQAGGLAATAADYGKWVAVDDFYDTSAGFVMDTDLEAAKVVPQLEPFDLLLVRADVVHRTADNNVYRVSLRFDLGPDQSWSTLGTLHRYTKNKKSTHAIICGWFARWPRVAPLLMLIHSFKRFSLKCVGYITPFKSIDVETPPFVLTKA